MTTRQQVDRPPSRACQKELPFFVERGVQLRVLPKVFFPSDWKVAEGKAEKGVTGMVLKAVILVIDDHARSGGWCSASHWTIGREANMNVGERDKPRTSHVRRSIKILEEKGFLISSPQKRKRQNKLRINWSMMIEVADLATNDRDRIQEDLGLDDHQEPNVAIEPSSTSKRNIEPAKLASSEKHFDAPEKHFDAPESRFDAPQRGDKTIETKEETKLKRMKRKTRALDRSIGFLDLTEGDVDRADRLMGEIFNVVRADPGNRNDFVFVAKIATMVVAGRIGETIVASALQSMREGRKSSVRYFVGCMKNAFTKRGMNIADCLAKTYVDQTLMHQAIPD